MNNLQLILIISTLLIRVLSACFFPAGFDEAYYSMWGQYLSFGYFDHPPIVALAGSIGPALTGSHTLFPMRMIILSLSLINTVLLYKLCKNNFGGDTAGNVVILFNTLPFFAAGANLLLFPDGPFFTFTLLFLLSLQKYQLQKQRRELIIGAVFLGLAMLTKYHGVLLVLTTLIYFHPFSKEKIIWRMSSWYIAMVIVLIIIMPNLVWNYQNNWTSYIYQFGKGGGSGHLSIHYLLQFLGGQLLYLLPWNAILIIVAIWKFRHQDRSLLLFSCVPIIIFSILGATREIMPHWTMYGWMLGLIFMARLLMEMRRHVAAIIHVVNFTITNGIIVLLLIQSYTGFLNIDRKADLTLDGQGWKQVVAHIQKKNLEYSFLAGHKWFTAGEISLAVNHNVPVLNFNTKHPHHFGFLHDPLKFKEENAIFITTERFPVNVEKKLGSYFSEIIFIDTVITTVLGKERQRFYTWYCKEFTGYIPYKTGSFNIQ